MIGDIVIALIIFFFVLPLACTAIVWLIVFLIFGAVRASAVIGLFVKRIKDNKVISFLIISAFVTGYLALTSQGWGALLALPVIGIVAFITLLPDRKNDKKLKGNIK